MNCINLKRFIITLSLFCCVFSYSYCQKNFYPGFILHLNGDTLHGYIKFINTERNPFQVTFKKELNTEDINFTPSDIKAFGVKDEFFISANVQSEYGLSDTKELDYDSAPRLKRIIVFLQTIVTGEKSLYYYHRKYEPEHFYIKRDTTFELLVYKKYLFKEENISVEKENKRYQNQLYFYLQDCPTIAAKLDNVEYYKSDMEKLFVYYYDNMNQKMNFHKSTESVTFKFGVVAGLSITNLQFSGGGPYYLLNADFNPSLNITCGGSLDIVLPKNSKRLSIYNELLISSFSIDGNSTQTITPGVYTTTSSNFKYSYLKLNNLVRYKLINNKFPIFINAGISNGILLKGTNYAKSVEHNYASTMTYEGDPLTNTKSAEQGFLFGIGSTFKKYAVELRYEYGNGMGINTGTISGITRIFCLLEYKF